VADAPDSAQLTLWAVNGRLVRADVENSGMTVKGAPMESVSENGSLADGAGFGSRI
jgi:hypothetical protein